MTKKIFLYVISCLFCGCSQSVSNSSENLYSWFRTYPDIDSIRDKQLVLFICQDMCTECVKQELINMNELHVESLIVVGVFEKKRYMMSTLNNITKDIPFLYICSDSCKDVRFPQGPVYFVFDKRQKIINDIFIPNACDTAKTMDYYREVEKGGIKIFGVKKK